MKKVLLLTMLISGFAGTGYLINTAYADDDYDDDRYEKYERDDYKYKEKYISVSSLPTNIQTYLSTNYNGVAVKKVEKKSYGYEVKLSNGTEIKFDTNGNVIKVKFDDDKYRNTKTDLERQRIETEKKRLEQERKRLEAEKQNLTQEKKQYKYLNTSVQEKLDNIIQVKLFDRIKNLSTDKQILALDTIVSKVDTLVEKIKSQTTLTTNDYVKLDVLEYLKDKVLTYKASLQDPTTDVINSIFGN